MSTNATSPLDPSIAFALLAAGRGTRFGEEKLRADLGGRALWRWAAESAEIAGFVARQVVTNDPEIARDAEVRGWTVHPNPAADEGLASSIRVAAVSVPDARRLVVALADMPFVEPDHLRTLAQGTGAAFTRQSDGRDGVPAAFPRSAFTALAQLVGDRGAAALDWTDRHVVVPRNFADLLDVDTPPDLARARSLAIRRARVGGR